MSAKMSSAVQLRNSPIRGSFAKRLAAIASVFVAVGAMMSPARAAQVGLVMVINPATPGCVSCTLSGPGTWNLFARDLSSVFVSDSFGISGFSIPVLNVTSVFNRSPRTIVNPTEEDAPPAGFTLARSANNALAIPGGFLISGAQDSATPTPYLVRGFGQESSSFATKFPGATFAPPTTQSSWSSPLALAEGLYNPGGPTPTIDFASVDVAVSVFSSAFGRDTKAATVFPCGPFCDPPRQGISVSSNGKSILDNDLTPSLEDNTDFGSVIAGGGAERSFTISAYNPKLGTILLQPPVFTGPYSVVGTFPSSVSAGNSVNFTIALNTNAGLGQHPGSISFATNAFSEPFNFALNAHIVPEPSGFAVAAMGFATLMGSIRRSRRGKPGN